MPSALSQCTLEQYGREFSGRHRLHDVIRYWAARIPEEPALINATRGRVTDWATLDRSTAALAARLLALGFRKGDFLVSSLPFLDEHILLEYACFRIGVISAPLDLRLPPAEVLRSVGLVRAKGFAFLGATPAADYRELGRAVQKHCPFVEHLVQFSPPEDTIAGAIPFASLAAPPAPEALRLLAEADAAITPDDGAQVIFTTGSTGTPKPALLSHRNITCQNLCLGAAFGFRQGIRMLVNLPPSHVGGQAEELMTTLFHGGTAVTLEIFDAAKSLAAIEEHRVHLIGQIPAMFQMEWRLGSYATYDLSSLETVIFGGQAAPPAFVEKAAAMAPAIATGLGLTEAAGFCTYTPPGASPAELSAGLGFSAPLYPMSVRAPMRDDRSAGDELPSGELGQICFRGPQTFLGYVNDAEATAKSISSDGHLYTGDLGYRDERGLHFSGRAKWVIKPAGYQVFPVDVENHFHALADRVAACGVVGVSHAVRSEGIVAFVEKKPGAEVTVDDLRQHARTMASYMRPLHYVVLDPGQLPLNRVAKVDYVRLRDMAEDEVRVLREARRWDR